MAVALKKLIPHLTLVRHFGDPETFSLHSIIMAPEANYLPLTDVPGEVQRQTEGGIEISLFVTRGEHIDALDITTPISHAFRVESNLTFGPGNLAEVIVFERIDGVDVEKGRGIVRYEDADSDDPGAGS